MMMHEQQTSRREIISIFLGGDNLSKHYIAVTAAAIFMIILFGSVCVLADNADKAGFDCNENIVGDIAGITILRCDDLHLRENGKDIDAVDWRVKGKRSADNSLVVRQGVNGQFSVTVSAEVIAHGFQVTWAYEILPDPAGKSVSLAVHVPAAGFQDIPQQPGKTIKFGPDKKASVTSGSCVYQFDLSSSDVEFYFAGLEDFRHADWWKDFRLNLETQPTTRKSGKIVLRVTGGVSDK